MNIKAILFDLDGTLIDTTEFIYQAYDFTLTSHGFEVAERKALSPLIGQSLHDIYQKIAPLGNPQILADTHVSFQSEHLHLVETFPSIAMLLNKLKKLGFRLGIVTSRYKNTLKTLKAANLEKDLFDVIVSGDDVDKVKPDPGGVILALKKLTVKPNQTLLVGDSTADIEMGKNAKVKTVGVTYGFGGKEIVESNPDFVIGDINQLLKVLKLE